MSAEGAEEDGQVGDASDFLATPPSGFSRAVQILDLIPPAVLEELASQVCVSIVKQRGGVFSEAELATRMAPTPDEREVAATSPPALLQARQAINATSHIFREAARRRVSPQEFAEGITASGISQGSCAVLARVFRQRAPALAAAESARALLTIGTLESFDWKLSVRPGAPQPARAPRPRLAGLLLPRSAPPALPHRSRRALMRRAGVRPERELGVTLHALVQIATESSACAALQAPHVALRLRVSDPSARLRTHAVEMTIPEFEAFAAQASAPAPPRPCPRRFDEVGSPRPRPLPLRRAARRQVGEMAAALETL